MMQRARYVTVRFFPRKVSSLRYIAAISSHCIAHEIRNEVVYPELVVGKSARYWQKRQKLCLLDKGNTNNANFPRERRHRKSMTHPSVHVQIAPTSVPSTPSWLGEVAVLAHVFSQLGLQKAIEERVGFARARMGNY